MEAGGALKYAVTNIAIRYDYEKYCLSRCSPNGSLN